jgi:hypothetical protein
LRPAARDIQQGNRSQNTRTYPGTVPELSRKHTQGQSPSFLDGLAVVLGVSLSRVSQPVYNIEVHGEHVYQVGELGLVVRNTCEVVLQIGKSTAKLSAENGALRVADIYVQGGDNMLRMFDHIRKFGAANGAKTLEATAEFLNFPLRDRLMKMGFQFEKIGSVSFGDIWKITGGL